MPVIQRSEDAEDAAEKLFNIVTTEHTTHAHVEYGPVRITVAWCIEHQIVECLLFAVDGVKSEPMGICDIICINDLARVIDSVIVTNECVANLASVYAESIQFMPARKRPSHA